MRTNILNINDQHHQHDQQQRVLFEEDVPDEDVPSQSSST